MLRRLACLLVFLCFAAPASAQPHHILLIRHAEKPEKEAMDVHLLPIGKKRAELLPELFVKSASRPDPFPRPDFLFAAKNSKNSHRSVETVTPLSERMSLKLHAEIKNEDYPILAKELLTEPKFAKKTVLVAWHHGKLPEFAKALGATDAPDAWKAASFDRVWEITYHGGGKVTFRDRPQSLMPDDSK
jgi:hypothetical protein